MVIIRYPGLWFPLADKGLKLQEIVQLYSFPLVFKLPPWLRSFCVPAWGIEPSLRRWQIWTFLAKVRTDLQFPFYSRLLFNVNHLPLWLSFCMRVALGLLGFSCMDDMCMSDVFEKSDQLGPVSAVCAWFVNVQTAWGMWKGLKA